MANDPKVVNATENVPFNVVRDPDDGVRIDAFNEQDDELAGVSKEELLAELGIDETSTEASTVKVAVDALTGERTVTNSNDDAIASLQELDPEVIKKRLSDIARQNIMLLIPDGFTAEDADEIITELEQKIVNISRLELKNLSAAQVKAFIGEDLYNKLSRFNPNPGKTARQFLVDLKDSVVEGTKMINTIQEINTALPFFEKAGINDFEKEIQDSLGADSEYATPQHKYAEYLRRYISRLQEGEDAATNTFIIAEIATCQKKLTALEEALTFSRLRTKALNMKTKIKKDFKDQKKVVKIIQDFIGYLNADESTMISFPVPKNLPKNSATPEYLTFIWLSFVALIDIRSRFEVLSSQNFLDYSDMASLLTGKTTIPVDENGIPTDERLVELKELADTNGITKQHVQDSEKFAVIFTYLLARTFKPTVLADEETRYILSYTMNILAQGLNTEYKAIVNGIINDIKNILVS